MGKVLLIIGAVIGGLIVAFGILAMIGTLTDNTLSSTDRNDQILGSIIILSVGLAVFVPCTFFAVRSGSRTTLSLLNQGMVYGGGGAVLTAAYAPVDLTGSYIQWFGWCMREIGGSAIALHAATMAAMAEGAAGNSGGAAAAARQAAGRASALPGAQGQAVKTPPRKIQQLARIGAGTLPLLEPGERVVVSFYGTDRQAQMWRSLFGVVGMLIAMSQLGAYFVTVTDRRLIALAGAQLSRTPSEVAFVVPLSMVSEARYRRGLFGSGTFRVNRMDGGRTRIGLTRYWKFEGSVAQNALAAGVGLTPLPPSPGMLSRGSF